MNLSRTEIYNVGGYGVITFPKHATEILMKLMVEIFGEGRSVGKLREPPINRSDNHNVCIFKSVQVFFFISAHIVFDFFF